MVTTEASLQTALDLIGVFVFALSGGLVALPTGSGTAYAYQYKRADGKWVTALWFHRGEGAMEVESVGGTLTKMYGQESALAKGKVEVAV